MRSTLSRLVSVALRMLDPRVRYLVTWEENDTSARYSGTFRACNARLRGLSRTPGVYEIAAYRPVRGGQEEDTFLFPAARAD